MAGLIMTQSIDITREEYKELLRNSLQLEAVKSYILGGKYVTRAELMLILDMKEEETNEYNFQKAES